MRMMEAARLCVTLLRHNTVNILDYRVGGKNLFDLVYSNPVIIPPKILRYSGVD